MHILDIVLTVIMGVSAIAYLLLVAYGLKNIEQLMMRVHLGVLVDDLFTAPKLKLAAVTLGVSIAICLALGLMMALWTMLIANVVLYAISYYAKRRLDLRVAH